MDIEQRIARDRKDNIYMALCTRPERSYPRCVQDAPGEATSINKEVLTWRMADGVPYITDGRVNVYTTGRGTDHRYGMEWWTTTYRFNRWEFEAAGWLPA